MTSSGEQLNANENGPRLRENCRLISMDQSKGTNEWDNHIVIGLQVN